MLTRNCRTIVLTYALACIPCALATSNLLAQAYAPALTEDSSSSSLATRPATQQRFVYQNGWAGYILYAPGNLPPSGQTPKARFKSIEAEWIVPSAAPSINCDLTGWFEYNGQWTNQVVVPQDGSSIWIGIDGWLYEGVHSDVLQAGTETVVNCWNGKPLPPASADFWIEWVGTRDIPLDWPKNVVRVGDRIHVTITAKTDGSDAWQYATVTLENKTREQQTGHPYLYSKSFPSGCLTEKGKCKIPHATLFGNTAEWVAEINFDEWQYCPEQPSGQTCPNPQNAPNTLSNFTDSIQKFGTVLITGISVTDVDGNVYTPSSHGSATPEIDWMTWTGKGPVEVAPNQYEYAAGNALLGCAAITGPQSVLLSRAPYSIVEVGDQGNIPYKPLTCDDSQ
jgi:hypothetical protein